MVLVILGSGRCVWTDLARLSGEYDYMAVNDVGMHFPGRLLHWYSNDAGMLIKWHQARRPGYNKDVWLHSCNKGVAYVHDNLPNTGTSPLNACIVGLRLGYESIVLCGVPLDNSGHYFDPPWVKSNFENEVPPEADGIKYWSQQRFKGRVFSMSGRTRELLGGPE